MTGNLANIRPFVGCGMVQGLPKQKHIRTRKKIDKEN
jgi:hypothetical protein